MERLHVTWLELAFRHHRQAVFRYARRRVSTREDAMDVTSETFSRAVDRLNRSTVPPAHAKAYLLGIARNVIYGTYKERKNFGELVELLGLTARAERRRQLASLHAPDDPRAAALVQALAGLSPTQQELLRLVYWDDLTTKEISEVLGINHDAVRKQLSRARTIVRKLMDDDAAEMTR